MAKAQKLTYSQNNIFCTVFDADHHSAISFWSGSNSLNYRAPNFEIYLKSWDEQIIAFLTLLSQFLIFLKILFYFKGESTNFRSAFYLNYRKSLKVGVRRSIKLKISKVIQVKTPYKKATTCGQTFIFLYFAGLLPLYRYAKNR
jgi:hypothetical protein